MHSIRLLVDLLDGSTRDGLGLRLRGVHTETLNLSRLPAGSPPGTVALLTQDFQPAGSLLRAGVPVLVHAERVPDADAVNRLHDTAREAGTVLAVRSPDRYLPSRQLVARQLHQSLGEPGVIRLHRWEPPPAPRGPEPNLPDGLLRDLDLALWLARQRPDRVFALVRHLENQAGLSVQVHLGFPSGAMALVDYTGWLPAGDGYHSLSVIGSAGAAYADDHQNTQLLFGGGRPQGLRTEERAGVLAAMTREFLDGLEAGADLLTASETDWKTLFAVTQAIQKSLASGLAVPLEDR